MVLSQEFAHHENLEYGQYVMLHLVEVDGGGHVDSEAVEGDGGTGGERCCEVLVRTARDGVGVGECGEGYGGGL